MGRALRHVVDGAILVEWPGAAGREANAAAVAIAQALAAEPPRGLYDAIPGARTLLVLFAPELLTHRAAEELLARIEPRPGEAQARTVKIATVYGGASGPDLDTLARRAGAGVDELVRAHAAAEHRVAFLGFAPGFAYLIGAPRALAVPRLATPRVRVPAGSVAVADGYSGIYPAQVPGGWHLIGRTATRLFDASRKPPALLSPGDRVVFEPVTDLDFSSMDSTGENILHVAHPVLRVISPGAFTSVQGGPGYGLGSSGVPRGGAMDLARLAAANSAVGNPPLAPGLEITVSGPEVELLADAELAVGGDIDCSPADPWPRAARAGDRVKFGPVRHGVRAYVAIRGGLSPAGAEATTRRLRAGDLLGRAGTAPLRARIPEQGDRDMRNPIEVRAIPGPHLEWFSSAGIDTFFSSEYTASTRSDRRGLRLDGPRIELSRAADLPPEGVTPGAVQVPGDGLPIALGPDGPVTGGYPRVATVIGADLGLLAQVRPGQKIRFVLTTLAEALAVWRRS
ncbi:MAG TPA: 5-oxoprolinase subunit PxpB [Myxococcales bacterium]|nr:5-oxoprolinase subunit PxpB [Myxococcales bacterium]